MRHKVLKLYQQTVLSITVFLAVSSVSFLDLWPVLVFSGAVFFIILVSVSHHRDVSIPYIAPFFARQYFKTKFRIMGIKNGHSTMNHSSIHMEPLFKGHHMRLADKTALVLDQIYLKIIYHFVAVFQASAECFDLVMEEACLLYKHIHVFDHQRKERMNADSVRSKLDKKTAIDPMLLEDLYEKLFIMHRHKQKKLKILSVSAVALLLAFMAVSTTVFEAAF